MRVNYDPNQINSQFVQDIDSIGRKASDESDRREALQHCLENAWATDEIGCIERVENKVRWGWLMYPYRQ